MSTEADTYHKSYMEYSHEYQGTLRRFGRNLNPEQVRDILEAHSFTERDLLDDEHDNIVSGENLPETLDAAMLYAWLGY